MEAKLRRYCLHKPKSGRLDVPVDVHKQFNKGGAARKELLQILIKAEGKKDFGACVMILSLVGFYVYADCMSDSLSHGCRMLSSGASSTSNAGLREGSCTSSPDGTPKSAWPKNLAGQSCMAAKPCLTYRVSLKCARIWVSLQGKGLRPSSPTALSPTGSRGTPGP